MKLVIEIDPSIAADVLAAIDMLSDVLDRHPDDASSDDLPRNTAVAAVVEALAPAVEKTKSAMPSEEEAIAALQALVKSKGVPGALPVLQSFGVARVTELAAEQRQAFIAAAANAAAPVEV